MTDQNKWNGQSQAKVLGFKIFVFILNTFGLNPAYFLLRFVSFYYFLFSKRARRAFSEYWRVTSPNLTFWQRQKKATII